MRCPTLIKFLNGFRHLFEERGIPLQKEVEARHIVDLFHTASDRLPPTLRYAMPCVLEDCGPMEARELIQCHAQMLGLVRQGFSELGKDLDGLKEENARLKEELVHQLERIASEVEPEYFHWILTIMGCGSVMAASKVLKMPNSSLSRQLKLYLKRGGLYRTLYGLLEIRRRGYGRKKLEQFNEAYLRHQAQPSPEADTLLLKEIFEALQAQNSHNWELLRDEVLELLKEHGWENSW